MSAYTDLPQSRHNLAPRRTVIDPAAASVLQGCGGTGLCMACLTEHAPCQSCHGTGACQVCEANGEPCQTGGLSALSECDDFRLGGVR